MRYQNFWYKQMATGPSLHSSPQPRLPIPPTWESQIVCRLGAASPVLYLAGHFHCSFLETHIRGENTRLLCSVLVCDRILEFLRKTLEFCVRTRTEMRSEARHLAHSRTWGPLDSVGGVPRSTSVPLQRQVTARRERNVRARAGKFSQHFQSGGGSSSAFCMGPRVISDTSLKSWWLGCPAWRAWKWAFQIPRVGGDIPRGQGCKETSGVPLTT